MRTLATWGTAVVLLGFASAAHAGFFKPTVAPSYSTAQTNMKPAWYQGFLQRWQANAAASPLQPKKASGGIRSLTASFFKRFKPSRPDEGEKRQAFRPVVDSSDQINQDRQKYRLRDRVRRGMLATRNMMKRAREAMKRLQPRRRSLFGHDPGSTRDSSLGAPRGLATGRRSMGDEAGRPNRRIARDLDLIRRRQQEDLNRRRSSSSQLVYLRQQRVKLNALIARRDDLSDEQVLALKQLQQQVMEQLRRVLQQQDRDRQRQRQNLERQRRRQRQQHAPGARSTDRSRESARTAPSPMRRQPVLVPMPQD